jgi:uncharacterized protein (DUF433 family)
MAEWVAHGTMPQGVAQFLFGWKTMKALAIGTHLVMDPEVCFGKLIFKGTRLPVSTVLTWLAKGKSMDSILEDWPYLTREAVAEAIKAARDALAAHCSSPAPTNNHESLHSRRTTRGQRGPRPAAKTPENSAPR